MLPAQAAAGGTAIGGGFPLTDEHHAWVTAFTGIDTRAGSSPAAASGDSPSGGGFFSGVANAVSDAASGVASAVGEAVSGAAEAAGSARSPAATDDHETR